MLSYSLNHSGNRLQIPQDKGEILYCSCQEEKLKYFIFRKNNLLIAHGEHSKYIQGQLGHSSIKVTMDTYGHLMDIVNRKAVNLLGRSIFGGMSNNWKEPKLFGSKMVAEDQNGIVAG